MTMVMGESTIHLNISTAEPHTPSYLTHRHLTYQEFLAGLPTEALEIQDYLKQVCSGNSVQWCYISAYDDTTSSTIL